MRWGHLELGKDSGGLRHFLCGRPVHAGTGLRLRLPGGHVVRVRYEGDWREGTVHPLLYLSVGENDEVLLSEPSYGRGVLARLDLAWPDEEEDPR